MYKNPIDQLMDDHELILQVLDKMEAAIGRIARGEAVNAEHWRYFLGFCRDFADGIHHQKEEQVLFPALVKAGLPVEDGPIGCMLHEHEEGRGRIQGMEASIDSYARGNLAAKSALCEEAQAYIALLRNHIAKENQVLFMMANRLLSIIEKSKMSDQFTEILGQEKNKAIEQGAKRGLESMLALYP